MLKRICVIIVVLALIIVAGCSSGSTTVTPTQAADVKQVREAEVAGQWAVKQMEINLDSSISLLLKLAEGDTVEGYFYLEKGNDVDFEISGKSRVYQSVPVGASANITSDRFSFTATGAQGIAYTLKLSPAEKTGVKKVTPTVFLEIIYPVSGELFVPLGTK